MTDAGRIVTLRAVDDGAKTHREFAQAIVDGGEKFIDDMFNELNPKERTFNTVMQHQSRNLFPSCLLYDATRVHIAEEEDSSKYYARQTDFYHASHVDSYARARGYILAQAPFDILTEASFWMMCYQQRPALIVLLGAMVNPDGKRTMKNFWPMPGFDRLYNVNKLTIKCGSEDFMMGKGRAPPADPNERIVHYDEYTVSLMRSWELPSSAVKFTILHFRQWTQDMIIPGMTNIEGRPIVPPAQGIYQLRDAIKRRICRISTQQNKKPEELGPILMVCPSGVFRCGAFATIDIVLDRIDDKDQVGLDETIRILREQRHGCVPTLGQYNHIRDIIHNYIQTRNTLRATTQEIIAI